MKKTGTSIIYQSLLFVVLLGAWLVLSGFFQPLFIGFGIISCLIAVKLSAHLSKDLDAFQSIGIRLLKLPIYVAWLIKEIFMSSVQVAKIVWHPKLPISPIIAWVPTKQKDDIALTCFANSITLTPGTVSVVVEKDRICVHGLQREAVKELASGAMDAKVSAWAGGNA
jgi:multicomponent Na+:H+ antiporter subunit E